MGRHVYLEGFMYGNDLPIRVVLDTFPFTIGRHRICQLQLNTSRVSREHAQIDLIDGQLYVIDLNSRNGTYVEHQRITQATPIQHGDIVHFAEHEFRLLDIDEGLTADQVSNETMIGLSSLPSRFPTQQKEFAELLDRGLVQGFCQVITNRQGEGIGYELLGRGAHPGCPRNPQPLFALASILQAEVALSQIFLRQCLAEADAMGLKGQLFFNTHPKECQEPERLLTVLQDLRRRYPTLPLVCEIHEAAVTDARRMGDIRAGLQELDIKLAYDDFGAGRARLLELVEVPPDVLKFDYSLVAGLTGPEAPMYRLLGTFTALVKDMGIATLAEGIETEAVARMCDALNIEYFQGYFYGRPVPITPASPQTTSSTSLLQRRDANPEQ